MRVWSNEKESKKLAERFVGVNRAAFAREFKVPGGADMVYQHVHGMRPISMEAAMSYARGFGVPLGEISPRQAKLAMEALGIQMTRGGVEPIPDKFARLHRLSDHCQEAILTLADEILARQRSQARS
jgi:hypothetical protein